LSGNSLLTCLTWGTLPVATLPLASFLISFDHTHPTALTRRDTIRGIVQSLRYTLHTYLLTYLLTHSME
jgi:hypothetical protein